MITETVNLSCSAFLLISTMPSRSSTNGSLHPAALKRERWDEPSLADADQERSDRYLQVSFGDGFLLHPELEVLHFPGSTSDIQEKAQAKTEVTAKQAANFSFDDLMKNHL